MMEKPWLANYPEGVVPEIDADAFDSLFDLVAESMERYPENTAFISFGKSVSYAEVDHLSRGFAAWLQGRGLQKGDRIALMMPNILQYPIALFGALRAGLVVVNTNPMYTARELRHQLQDSGARAIVVLENFAGILERVKDEVPVEHIVTTRIGDRLGFPKGALISFALKYLKKAVPPFDLPDAVRFNDAIREGLKRDLEAVAVEPGDLAFLQYTGGTTGVAKGAMLTHRNMIANTLQCKAWFASIEIGSGDEVGLAALPLYHIFALTVNCFMMSAVGGCNLLIANPRDTAGLIKEISKYPITILPGVNTLFNALLNTPGIGDVDFSALKGAIGGGMAVQQSVADQWLAKTGKTLVEGYGLTETSPVACVNPLDAGYTGYIGLPVSSTECAVMDDSGAFLPQGEAGELAVRGPQVMKGYWQRPDETAKVLTEDGWLKTGDVAMMSPDGFFKIVDRKKDMILVSGFNVFPNEIEDVVAHHPKVLEVAVIGVPDPKSTEAVKMFVVKSDDSLTEDELRAFCKEELTGYKRPRHIEFRDELPKTNVGKILRRELREEETAKT